MRNIPFEKTLITGGFWADKQNLVRTVSMRSIYDRFTETGRFDAFNFDWKEGMPNKPHIFWDSDVAKWLESAAYLIANSPERNLKLYLTAWLIKSSYQTNAAILISIYRD